MGLERMVRKGVSGDEYNETINESSGFSFSNVLDGYGDYF